MAGQPIGLYRKRIEALDYPSELLRLYLSEGDSTDTTLAELQAWACVDERITIIKRDTGIPRQWHTTRPERMKAMAETGNANWDLIAADAWGDFALMLEADLLYPPNLLRQLLARKPPAAAIFAPMIWINVSGYLRFYDVWAFRTLEDRLFEPAPPAWYFQRHGEKPFEVGSVGSVVLFEMECISGGLRLCEREAVYGMCKRARAHGYKVFADPTLHVLHPSIAGIE